VYLPSQVREPAELVPPQNIRSVHTSSYISSCWAEIMCSFTDKTC